MRIGIIWMNWTGFMDEKTITRITYGIVIFVALCAFIISFQATADVALHRFVSSIYLSWAVPFVIEGSILAFAVASLYQVMNGERRIVSTSLVVLFTLLSISINVSHAKFTGDMYSLDNIFTAIIAAAPPFGLACSFEMLLAILKSQTKKSSTIKTIGVLESTIQTLRENRQSLEVEIENAKQKNEQQCKVLDENAKQKRIELETLNEAIEKQKTEQMSVEDAMFLQFLKRNPDTSQAEAARFVEISAGQASRKVKEFKEAGLLHKNGHGWEVKV